LPLFTGAYPGVLQAEIAACSLHHGAQTPLLGGTRRPQRMISAADRPHPSHQWLLAAAFI